MWAVVWSGCASGLYGNRSRRRISSGESLASSSNDAIPLGQPGDRPDRDRLAAGHLRAGDGPAVEVVPAVHVRLALGHERRLLLLALGPPLVPRHVEDRGLPGTGAAAGVPPQVERGAVAGLPGRIGPQPGRADVSVPASARAERRPDPEGEPGHDCQYGQGVHRRGATSSHRSIPRTGQRVPTAGLAPGRPTLFMFLQ